ncbi:MAG: polysaccharide pyruvyl transferase family protein [bacterium]
MNILIFNASYGGNKGAEAMITTLLLNISNKIPDATFYIDAFTQFNTYFNKIQQTLKAEGINIEPVVIRPKKVFSNIFFGIRDKNNKRIKVDTIIDISGLSFTDNNIRGLVRTLLKNISLPINVKLIRFTQDFGPSEKLFTRLIARLILIKTSKIFPRSAPSRELVKKLAPSKEITKPYPDSAIILPVKESKYKIRNSAIIVPNEHSYSKYQQKYIDTLTDTINYLKKINLDIYLVQHSFTGKGDAVLIKAISQKYPDINIIDENIDSRELKHVISQAKIVIASRYHAVIAALSMNVPCVTIGWNPKYEQLYKTYNLDYNGSISSTIVAIKWNINNYEKIKNKLHFENTRIKYEVNESFNELIDEILKG